METLDHFSSIVFAMLEPRAGKGAKISIFRGKNFLAVRVIFRLHQPAGSASKNAQRVPFFRGLQFFFADIGIGRRCAAEIRERKLFGSLAVSTFHGSVL